MTDAIKMIEDAFTRLSQNKYRYGGASGGGNSIGKEMRHNDVQTIKAALSVMQKMVSGDYYDEADKAIDAMFGKPDEMGMYCVDKGNIQALIAKHIEMLLEKELKNE